MSHHRIFITGRNANTNTTLPLDMLFWISLLLLLNLGLLLGNIPSDLLVFDFNALANGQWWRLCSWPLVHVSRYHLVLDGLAFLLLYYGLDEGRTGRRFMFVLCAAIGSLLLPLMISPLIYDIGLCGLSGVAHGLVAVSSLEMLRHDRQRIYGVALLAGVFFKVVFELSTGTILFQSLHFGSIGQPIVSTHAGGVIGGITGYGLTRLSIFRRSFFMQIFDRLSASSVRR